MRSHKDLQSVVIISCLLELICLRKLYWGVGAFGVSSLDGGIAANAGGSLSRVSSACCHRQLPSCSQAQYRRTQDRISTAPANDIASADNVLTTTFCIFLECHTTGFTGLFLFSPMSL